MISVVNKSTLCTDAEVKAMVQAVAHQLRYDAAPLWGKSPSPVVYASTEADAQPGSWVIAVLDNADQADQSGALGWHTEDQGEAIYGRVFAGPVLDNGGDVLHAQLSVASVLSHEVLETFVDPNVNLWADMGNGRAVALEVGDPVEADSYTIAVRDHGDVTVSNFVTPAWFDPQARAGAPLDYLNTVSSPFEMTKSGYMITLVEGKVNQVFGERYPEWRRATKASGLARTFRRGNKRE
jgi:hypothetical protein